MHRSIEAVVAWHTRVLGVRTIRASGPLLLSELVGPLPVPAEVARSVRSSIIELRGKVPHVVIPLGAQGWVERAGQRRRSLDELHHEGHPFRCAPRAVFPPGTKIALASDATVQLRLGPLGLRISSAPDGARLAGHRRAAVDSRLAACCAAAGVSSLGLLVASAAAMPPLSASVEDEVRGGEYITVMVAVDESLAERQTSPELALGPDDDPTGQPSEMCLCNPDEMMGCPDADATSARYGVAGPADNADPHIARVAGKGGASTWVWPAWGPFVPLYDEAPVAPWGRDDSLGTDALSARGNMWGESIDDAHGDHGLGLSGSPGGLSKVLSTDPRRAASSQHAPRVVHSGLRVVGPRKPSAVLPIVAARFASFTRCYEAALSSEPELSGRVDLSFQVAPSGAVSHLDATSADISCPALASCLKAAVSGLSFPADATAPTAVTYPLLLRP